MIPFSSFTGEFPRYTPYSLPDTAAQRALDCDFTRGNLTGLRQRAAILGVTIPAGTKSIYVHDGLASRLFAWTREVDVVRGPVVNDQYQRFYWADGTNFYVSRGDVGGAGQEPSTTNRYKVGVPCPAAPLEIIEGDSLLELPGVVSGVFSAFYETPTGEIFSTTVLPDNAPTTHTMTSYVRTWIGTGLSGEVEETGSGVTLMYDSFQMGFHLLRPDPNRTPVPMPGYTPPPAHTTYFHHPDYLNTPLPLTKKGVFPLTYTYYVPSGSESGGHLETHEELMNFYPLGYGWYATVKDAGIPDGATGIIAETQAGTLALRIVLTMQDGAIQSLVVRQNGNDSIPDDFSDYNFTFVVSGDTLTLSVSSKINYLEHRAYTYSYVNQYGEESGLAAPVEVNIVEGQPVTLRYTPLPDDSGYCPVRLIRLYRTATGSSGTTYSFVDEFVPNTTLPTVTDEKDGDALGPASDCAAFEPPPPALQGLCVMNNGIFVGFVGNELYFMEPYLPYAHTPSTVKPLPHRIVGICPTDDGLYVTTTAHPYLITGVSPDAMTDRKVPAIQAGVSKGSICSIGAAVVYATHDGLVLLRGIDASLTMGQAFFTRHTWRDLFGARLATMRLSAHDGGVVLWFADGTPGYLLRIDEASPSLTRLSEPIYAAFVYEIGDALYVTAGSGVYEFNATTPTRPFAWHSKEFVLPKPASFGCLQLRGTGTVQFTVIADGLPRHTETVTLTANGDGVYRLPSGFLALRWEVALNASPGTDVHNMTLAFSPTELRNG